MLRENNLIVRLRKQLEHMKKLNEYNYCCATCGSGCHVVSCRHIMSMSQAGPFYHIKPEGMQIAGPIDNTVKLRFTAPLFTANLDLPRSILSPVLCFY